MQALNPCKHHRVQLYMQYKHPTEQCNPMPIPSWITQNATSSCLRKGISTCTVRIQHNRIAKGRGPTYKNFLTSARRWNKSTPITKYLFFFQKLKFITGWKFNSNLHVDWNNISILYSLFYLWISAENKIQIIKYLNIITKSLAYFLNIFYLMK